MTALRFMGPVLLAFALFPACGDGSKTYIVICNDAGTCPVGGSAGMEPGSGGSSDSGTGAASGGSSSSGGSTSSGGDAGSATSGGSAGTPSGGSGSGGTPSSGGGPSGSVFFDDFEDGNADGWLNDNVAPTETPPGVWTVLLDGSNHVYDQSVAPLDDSTSRIAYIPGSWTDMTVEARVRMNTISGSSSSFYVGLCGRYLNISNYYCAALRHDGRFSLRARLNADTNTLGEQVDVDPPITAGVWYDVKLQIRSTTISGHLNGEQLSSALEATVPSGGIALITAGTSADFDDVRVTVP